ncbi:hypothetical protein BB560_001855 [Smittium megazygosporum]|uniref:Peptidyl-prolyl cis-trans isomerase n=1 Tax=Smittium megazygosporum TaxID=133381 RepID=A0A2T9ZGK8_9FUNG|nr:hypothetical protein BB560_001855 [Smittium megazygosporum]
MGKWTDKMYITHSEWANKFSDGGMKFGGTTKGSSSGKGTKVLPFKLCALSKSPFSHPVCTLEGNIFELERMCMSDFWETFYSKHQGCSEFNIKAKNMTDLISGEPFKKSDLITLYDPENVQSRIINDFYYVSKGISFTLPSSKKSSKASGASNNINLNKSIEKILAEVKSDEQNMATSANSKNNKDSNTKHGLPLSSSSSKKDYNASLYSEGRVAAGLTSTVMEPVTVNKSIPQSELEYMLPKIKSQTFVTLKTNFGDLNLALDSNKYPQACYNFLILAKLGCLDGLNFASCIRNLVLISEDPVNKLKLVDEGKHFKILSSSDVKERLKNEKRLKQERRKRGLISLVVSELGLGFQFMFTFTENSASHFDGQQIVFGQVVGGIDNLLKIQSSPVSGDDFTPINPITIEKATVLVDPFQEFQDRLSRKLLYENEKKSFASSGKHSTTAENTNLSTTSNWFGKKV